MRRLNVSILVVLSACALAGAAQAADMPLRGSQEAFAVREFVSPWYVRGDVGYWFSTKNGGSPSYSDVAALDFGIGYRGVGWRADVTTSYAFQPHANISPFGTPDIRARNQRLRDAVQRLLRAGHLVWADALCGRRPWIQLSAAHPVRVGLAAERVKQSGHLRFSLGRDGGFFVPALAQFSDRYQLPLPPRRIAENRVPGGRHLGLGRHELP